MLGRPFGEGEGGAAQNLLHGVRRRSRLLDEVGPVAEQSIGDVLGKALGEHRLANLRRRDLLPMEFAAYGLNGARVDRIAQRVGGSKNLIYHYFGSKDRLYLNALEAIYRQMRAEQDDLALQQLPPLEGMRQLVANTFDHFVRAPALIRLMSIENIHFARHLKKSKSVKPLYAPLLRTIRSLLAKGQADGVFRRNVDAVDLYISMSGLAYFYLSNRHSLAWIFDEPLDEPKRLQQRRAHVVDVILGYLQYGA